MNQARRLDRQDINRRRTPPLMPNVRDAGSGGTAQLCGCDHGTPAIPPTPSEVAKFGSRLFAESWIISNLSTLIADNGFSVTTITALYDGVSSSRNIWLVELSRTMGEGESVTVDAYDLLLTTDANGFVLRLSPQGEVTCPDVIDWRWGSVSTYPQPHSTNTLVLRPDSKTFRDSTDSITYVDPPAHCNICLSPKVAIICTEGNANLASWRSAKIVSDLSGFIVEQATDPLQFGDSTNSHCNSSNWDSTGQGIEIVTLKALGSSAASPLSAWFHVSDYADGPSWIWGDPTRRIPPGVCGNSVYDVGRLYCESAEELETVLLSRQPRVYATPLMFRLIYTEPSEGLVTGRFDVSLGFRGGCFTTHCSNNVRFSAWYEKSLITFDSVTLEVAKTLATNALASTGKVIHLSGTGSYAIPADPSFAFWIVNATFPSIVTIQCGSTT